MNNEQNLTPEKPQQGGLTTESSNRHLEHEVRLPEDDFLERILEKERKEIQNDRGLNTGFW